MFVVHDSMKVIPNDSYARKWHHFTVWENWDEDQLQTLKLAFPETRMVADPYFGDRWPEKTVPKVESEEANRLMHNAGLSRHLQDVDKSGKRQESATVAMQGPVEREKEPGAGLESPKPGM